MSEQHLLWLAYAAVGMVALGLIALVGIAAGLDALVHEIRLMRREQSVDRLTTTTVVGTILKHQPKKPA